MKSTIYVNVRKNFSRKPVCIWSPHIWLQWAIFRNTDRCSNIIIVFLQQQNFKSNELVIVFASGMHIVFIICIKFYMLFGQQQNYYENQTKK